MSSTPVSDQLKTPENNKWLCKYEMRWCITTCTVLNFKKVDENKMFEKYILNRANLLERD